MLIEFRVKNYKSIRDEAIFSLVPSTDKKYLETNSIESGIKSIPRVQSMGEALLVPYVFPVLHVAYGLGMLHGLVRFGGGRKSAGTLGSLERKT